MKYRTGPVGVDVQAGSVSASPDVGGDAGRREQAGESEMPEVIFNGSDGRLEGRYVHGEGPTPPLGA